jgi:hypothetical protein
MQNSSGFGIEEKELLVLLRTHHQALFGRQDHLQLYYINRHLMHPHKWQDKDLKLYRKFDDFAI